MTALDVYFHLDRVGRLERLDQGRLGFAYESAWVERAGAPLSLSLPVRERPFDDGECRPFFAGLLPEGEFLRAISRAFHVSSGNSFGLLAEIGGECAGAVSLVPRGEEPPFASAPPPRWLGDGELANLLAELPKRPLLYGADGEDEGLRLSLAGARDKLPVLAEGERLGITLGRPPSTHFIKAPIAEVDGMVANEAFCLALAAEVGLTAAEARPVTAGEREGLLVTRYDRRRHDADVRRIHQEDLCQALGFLPEQKYEADGGPGIEACAHLLRDRSAAPAVDLFAFLDALVFNLLTGNGDAHAKNYSLLLEGDVAPRLAPLYDVLSTRVYGRRFGRKMAMKYGGEYRFDRIRGRHVERLAAELGVSAKMTRTRVKDLSGRTVEALAGARERLPADWQDERVLDRIETLVRKMAEGVVAAAAEPA
ncbi:MAG TPA: type II toxin-antitoxin system HipA family toxin [Solirubrobacterales bacterium]|jgi:serine/threonine-protein kinase HipA|nr:type II toxin-antitoxin system HipA family toxin [Solirubrobacterales bacterium]